MKKIIISAFIILAAVSCYDPSPNAKVRINFGSIPLAPDVQMSLIDRVIGLFSSDAHASNAETYVQKLHIAAVSGNSILVSASIDAADVQDDSTGEGSFVELSLPAGEAISIIVIGEYNLEGRYANYFGRTAQPETFNAGETGTVSITMNSNFLYDLNPAIHYSSPYYISWNTISGARYVIHDNTLGITIYQGTGSSMGIPAETIYNDYTFTVIFDFADLSSFGLTFGGG